MIVYYGKDLQIDEVKSDGFDFSRGDVALFNTADKMKNIVAGVINEFRLYNSPSDKDFSNDDCCAILTIIAQDPDVQENMIGNEITVKITQIVKSNFDAANNLTITIKRCNEYLEENGY